MKSNLPVSLRLGADEARLEGSGGVFPVTFSGGEAITVTLDAVAVATTFTAGTLTAQECANVINSAAALAGLQYQPASVAVSGQIQIETNTTGVGSTAVVSAGPTAAIGFAGGESATGSGSDLTVQGFMAYFSPEVSRVQVSTGAAGASLDVFAASRL